jgi:hypothetical protein
MSIQICLHVAGIITVFAIIIHVLDLVFGEVYAEDQQLHRFFRIFDRM